MAPGPVPERGAEVCGQLPGPDSGAAGQSLIFCAEHGVTGPDTQNNPHLSTSEVLPLQVAES